MEQMREFQFQFQRLKVNFQYLGMGISSDVEKAFGPEIIALVSGAG